MIKQTKMYDDPVEPEEKGNENADGPGDTLPPPVKNPPPADE